jgi:hypothetical protein
MDVEHYSFPCVMREGAPSPSRQGASYDRIDVTHHGQDNGRLLWKVDAIGDMVVDNGARSSGISAQVVRDLKAGLKRCFSQKHPAILPHDRSTVGVGRSGSSGLPICPMARNDLQRRRNMSYGACDPLISNRRTSRERPPEIL